MFRILRVSAADRLIRDRAHHRVSTYVTTQSMRNFVTEIEQAHGRQLRRFASAQLGGSSVDVPDVIQEIFLRLLRIEDHETIRNPQNLGISRR